MLTREEIIEATRAFIREEVAHDPGLALGAEEPLVSGGLLTSLDLVSLTAFIERRFGVALPPRVVAREHLDSLEQVARLVLASQGVASPGAAAAEPPPPAPGASPGATRLFPSFRRAPALVLLALVLGLVVLDRVAGALLASPAVLEALEPEGHRHLYPYASFAQGLSRHRLGLTPKGPREVRIVGQGDSGTIGAYLPEGESCYDVAGRALEAACPEARFYNVSYFGQSFVKDAAILEGVLAYEPDVVVIALCTTHLERQVQDRETLGIPSAAVVNRAGFRRFLAQVPRRRELDELDAIMADTEQRTGLALRHRLEAISAIASNQSLLGSVLRPSGFEDARSRAAGSQRSFVAMSARDTMLLDFRFDERMLALLEAMIDRARRAGAEVVLLWEPEPVLRGDPPSAWPYPEAAFDRVRAALATLARERGVTVVDCSRLLPVEEFTDSSHHWTTAGNAAIARVLADSLEPVVARVLARRR